MVKITSHHNIPDSMGGSDEDVNLSHVTKARHENFHEFAENTTPDQLIRRLTIHALGAEKPPHPDLVREIFQITTMLNWTRLYRKDAFRLITEPSGLRRARKATEYVSTRTLEEIVDVRKTLQAICNGGTFPVQNSLMYRRALRFFTGNTLNDTLLSMHTEEDDRKDFAWIKPMQADTRTSILQVLRATSRKKTMGSPRQMVHILLEQKGKLEEHADYWRKQLRGERNNLGRDKK